MRRLRLAFGGNYGGAVKKAHILSEIARTASANGGVPLGEARSDRLRRPLNSNVRRTGPDKHDATSAETAPMLLASSLAGRYLLSCSQGYLNA
jgi:hypothetical protein